MAKSSCLLLEEENIDIVTYFNRKVKQNRGGDEMAELCRKCFIKTWHPTEAEIESIVVSEDSCVCEGCGRLGPYVEFIMPPATIENPLQAGACYECVNHCKSGRGTDTCRKNHIGVLSRACSKIRECNFFHRNYKAGAPEMGADSIGNGEFLLGAVD